MKSSSTIKIKSLKKSRKNDLTVIDDDDDDNNEYDSVGDNDDNGIGYDNREKEWIENKQDKKEN